MVSLEVDETVSREGGAINVPWQYTCTPPHRTDECYLSSASNKITLKLITKNFTNAT